MRESYDKRKSIYNLKPILNHLELTTQILFFGKATIWFQLNINDLQDFFSDSGTKFVNFDSIELIIDACFVDKLLNILKNHKKNS